VTAKQRTFDDMADGGEVQQGSAPPGGRVIDGFIVTEPLGGGVRVTARGHDNKLLWGFVAGQLAMDSPHVLVATYESLRTSVIIDLPSYVDKKNDGAPKTKQCLEAIESITAMLGKVRDKLSPKQITDKTEKRAGDCLPALRDIITMLTYELTDNRNTPAETSE
jgi:hypothetical protein